MFKTHKKKWDVLYIPLFFLWPRESIFPYDNLRCYGNIFDEEGEPACPLHRLYSDGLRFVFDFYGFDLHVVDVEPVFYLARHVFAFVIVFIKKTFQLLKDPLQKLPSLRS
jgi:hypothetical protein